MHFWKLRREVKRLQQQMQALAAIIYEPWLRYQHDKNRKHILKISQGDISCSKKIALFLIYQPTGISQSTLATCTHLRNKGYAPLLICNHPLNNTDKEKLSKHTWIIIERPNFGYDFGGYKDGILYLKSLSDIAKPTISHLIIINDSIWYPLNNDDHTIEKMEQSNASFVGALHMKSEQKSSFKSDKPPFFGSFFLMIKQDIYESDLFTQYWKKYQSTSSKYLTIKRGERQFSHLLLSSQFSSDYLYDKSILYEYIDNATQNELLSALKNSISLDPVAQQTSALLLTQAQDFTSNNNQTHTNTDWINSTRNLLKQISHKQNILSTLPIVALQKFGVSYLKKSCDAHNYLALKLVLRENINNNLSIDKDILLEIKSRC
jgi:hypothetical protein